MNLFDPKAHIVSNWFKQILKAQVRFHTEIIERIGHSMQTQKDVENFGALICAIYDSAYHKAINDYQQQLKKVGLNVKIDIVPENQLKSGE